MSTKRTQLDDLCKTDQKTKNYMMLFRGTKCPTEAEKIIKVVKLLTSEDDETKTNKTEFLFLHYNG